MDISHEGTGNEATPELPSSRTSSPAQDSGHLEDGNSSPMQVERTHSHSCSGHGWVLNGGSRVDYQLQESELEAAGEYLSALKGSAATGSKRRAHATRVTRA